MSAALDDTRAAQLLASRPARGATLFLERLAGELELATVPAPELVSASLEQVAEALQPRRHMLRLVELDAGSLPHLSLPTLVRLDDGLAALRECTVASVLVELSSGEQRRLTHGALLAAAGGRALVPTPTLLREGGFVSRVLHFVALRWTDLAQLAALSLLLTALGLALPYATRLVVDRALPERTPRLLALVALALFLTALQRGLFHFLQQRATLALHARLESAVTSSLFDHLLRIPYAALVRDDVGSWLETLGGARRVQTLVVETLLMPLLQLAMGLVFALALARHDLVFTGCLVLASLLLLLLSLLFALREARLQRVLIEDSARQQGALHEVLRGVLTLRTSGAEERGMLRWYTQLLVARGTAVKKDLLDALARALTSGLRGLISAAAFLWAAYACLHGELSVGALLSLTMLSERLVSVVAGFADILAPLLTARSHLARIDGLLAHDDVTRAPQRAPLRALPGDDAVVLEDVWFRYGPDQPWILEGYSLRIPALSHFVLQGASGVGKTTILRLIAGLYVPERGTVRVLGQPPRQLRAEICYLPQEVHLFQGSILQSLRLLSGASDEALFAAAARSGLAELVDSLPMRYETVLPAGGSNLSGGQRQLIVWTAAMATGRKLLLLDEALSQLDALARARLLAMVSEQARTLVSVEHETRHAAHVLKHTLG